MPKEGQVGTLWFLNVTTGDDNRTRAETNSAVLHSGIDFGSSHCLADLETTNDTCNSASIQKVLTRSSRGGTI